MKKIAIGLGAIVVLLVAAVVAAPFLIPAETIKTEMLAQVKEATGRDARIDGDFKISILPRVEFVAGKVTFANAPGGKAKNMVSVDRLNIQVALFPLIGGEVEIDAFVLEKPIINLEVNKAGRPNWEFGPAMSAKTVEKAKKAKATTKSSGSGASGGAGAGSGLSGLKLGDVRLVGGRVSYSDAKAGVVHKLDDINLKISLPSLDDPMKAEGAITWNKEKIELLLGLSNPNGFLNGKKTDIETKISATPVNLSFKGSAAQTSKIKAGGALDLDVPSIRKLSAWVGSPLAAPGAASSYGPLKITGQVDVDGQKHAFRQATLSVDKIKGTGAFTFDGSGRVPNVTGKLQLGMLDLNPYLPPEAKAGSKAAPKSGGGPSASKTSGKAATPSGSKAAASDWSNDPIDLSGLKAVNAKLDLAVAGILVRKIKIGQSNVNVSLRNGVLVTDLAKMALYGGNGKAKLTANGSGRTPRIALNFDLSNFKAHPFMVDAMDFDRVEGTANAKLTVATQGGSQRQLVSALNGSGNVQFLNGAIRGINLAAMLRNVASAFLDPDAKKAQKTDFAELGGTYVIRRGVLRNSDLSLKSPLLRLAGKGTVDMPKQTVNYRIEPKLVASTKGQGSSGSASGISVPVIVSGPWSNISYKPDLAGAIGGLAKDPSKALDSLKKLIPGKSGGDKPAIKIPDAVNKLKGLFGN
ncbi:MAG: AsmA family protein [Alphaproteobacteria bacterium]|nr:AsmA family protein [Alphaproteobacteria bacterium]